MKDLLGDCYADWEDSMKPGIRRNCARGTPAAATGATPIRVAYVLPRAKPRGADGVEVEPPSLSGTTMSLSGKPSKTRHADTMHTEWGFVPEYMFEDRERMEDLTAWFDKYGRPKPLAVSTSRPQFTTFSQITGARCCGEPSAMTKTRKGWITA